nr:hypothetical protein [Tanacetum cinerariifolium]
MFIEFVIQNQFFSYSLEEFNEFLDIPCEGACVFTDKWSLDELAYGVPTDDPYQTNLEYQVLTREIEPTLKPLEVIRENVFFLGGNRYHVPVCLCYMLYCAGHSEKFNLAYYMAKRIERVTRQKRLILLYGMLLTCMFKVIMNENHEFYYESYVLYDYVKNPPATQQERNLERIVAREEVVTSLPLLSPLTNHPLLISTMMMMMEMAKGPRLQALLHPFVMSIL